MKFKEGITEKNVIVKCGSDKFLPFAVTFGIYIIMFGTISPGGGFQGGVIVASAALLLACALLTYLLDPFEHYRESSILPLYDQESYNNPGIVRSYDLRVFRDSWYYIMEYVDGYNFGYLLSRKRHLQQVDCLLICESVAAALDYAWREYGIVHCDIKPDNIIINADGQAKVTDFGLATLADASGKGTTGGGTIGYMPLEQMRREHLDARTDEWSLAAMTYEMLTGENPFRAKTLEEAEKELIPVLIDTVNAR